MDKKEFVEVLLYWYDTNQRILPWRESKDPYRIWVSEIMLQQTRVEAVKPYYERFIETLPDIVSLANAEEEVLMNLWQGLGYYNRVRNMQIAARMMVEKFSGKFPDTYEEILSLKGIGEYTAGAVSSIAFGIPVPAVDGNVLRVFSRILESYDDILKQSTKRKITEYILDMMPKERAGDFNQAVMELGAMICIPNGAPLCEECPVASCCIARKKELTDCIPVKKKKSQRRVEKRFLFVMECENEVAIIKRKNSGLLAGLWEFPNIEIEHDIKNMEEAMKHSLQQFSVCDYDLIEEKEGKHIFSHIEWQLKAVKIKVKEKPEDKKLVFVKKSELEDYAIPTAFKLGKELLEEER
ncbi:MAG: A/G-specific adenine glycosylase [Lachnospiraceae bacterium]|nr:A/G-specific adenine glycosylase [Lachnospiraceae bacterium]